MDRGIVFLAGTGGGIYDVHLADTRVNKSGFSPASSGAHGMLAYHRPDFFGQEGYFKAALLYGQGLGAEVNSIGADGDLLDQAQTLRMALYGHTRLNQDWRIAQALIAEQIKNRYVPGDDYRYMTLKVRLANELTSNFKMQYELSWQTMNLNALGYDGRQAAKGDYWRLTFAPTFKAR